MTQRSTRSAPGSMPEEVASTGVGRILVTGATGFLGKHLLGALSTLEEKPPVRALTRHPTLALAKAGVEVVAGDVCDTDACARALAGIDVVYHAAGLVSRREADASGMYRVHVEGTRVLWRAAAAAGVRRIVLVSTSGTIGISDQPDAIADEGSPYKKALAARWPYYLSKIYQEQTALELGRELSLDVVVVNPSLLLGPGDDRSSSTGDVAKVVRGRLPLLPKGGGIAFVDARDAAWGCVLAMQKGVSGERYLLSSANMTLAAFFGRVARLAGVTAPRAVVAPWLVRTVGRVTQTLCDRFDVDSPIDAQSISMAEHTWYVDATKARTSLGWTPRQTQETLLDTVRDIQRRYNLAPKQA